MKKLEIDLADLTIAFEDRAWGMNYYLDLETGRVVAVSDEIQGQLEDLYAELDDAGIEPPYDLAGILREQDVPEWEQEAMLEADEVESGYGTRYVAIPQDDSHTGYRDMENFIFTVRDDDLQDRLFAAIRGRGAFRRFKDLLLAYPRERERWFTFKDERVRQRVLDWLAVRDIEPVLVEPAPNENGPEPPEPPARTRLIAEVLAFTRAARQLDGVVRITLIGSPATDEPDPKDADVLVTVSDDADLEPLATLGRKLAGRAQSFRRGGDVFLADPAGHYWDGPVPGGDVGRASV